MKNGVFFGGDAHLRERGQDRLQCRGDRRGEEDETRASAPQALGDDGTVGELDGEDFLGDDVDPLALSAASTPSAVAIVPGVLTARIATSFMFAPELSFANCSIIGTTAVVASAAGHVGGEHVLLNRAR